MDKYMVMDNDDVDTMAFCETWDQAEDTAQGLLHEICAGGSDGEGAEIGIYKLSHIVTGVIKIDSTVTSVKDEEEETVDTPPAETFPPTGEI